MYIYMYIYIYIMYNVFIAFSCSSTDYGYAGFPGRTSPETMGMKHDDTMGM